MLTTSQSVVSAADHTTMTTNSVPCRISMLPKIHRIPRNKSKKSTSNSWINPKKNKTTTTAAKTPVKKAAPPTIRTMSTPSTAASSPAASAAKSASPAASVVKEQQEASPSDVEEAEPKKQCAITFLPKVHKRVRPVPAPTCILDLPLQEISFVHSDQGDESERICKTLMFGEDEGFEDILNVSGINRNELDGHQQPNVNASMETERRRNREEKLNTSFPQNHEVTFDSDPINNTRVSNDLSFETTSSMAVNDRMHLNESPIRPSRHVVGEETIMDTSREVEMVRNSFFDNEEMVAELNKEKAEIPKEITAITVSTAVVDDRDFVSPMQRLRSERSISSNNNNLDWEAEQEKRAKTDQRDRALAKQKRKETKRKANIAKHMAHERKKQEAAAAAKAKKQEEEAMLQEMIAQAKQQEEAEKKARQEKFAKKKQVVKQQKEKEQRTSSPASIQKPTAAPRRTSSPQTPPTSTTGPFVPEWANKSLLRKTTTGSLSTSPSESAKSTVSLSSASASGTSKKVPEWANKQLRKSITRTSVQSGRTSEASSSSATANVMISDELSSWMGKRRLASEGVVKQETNK
mmetsp:Transcript_33162/g.80146  ORF Transcript_33162/g.80146 Transcript_33162/m.80146 type:complete len:579 (+) Transcript_33162:169-1905(+)